MNLIAYLKMAANSYYYHFVGHCGALCGLKWRIWRAKMYFSPPNSRVIVQAVLLSFFWVFIFSMPSKVILVIEFICSWAQTCFGPFSELILTLA